MTTTELDFIIMHAVRCPIVLEFASAGGLSGDDFKGSGRHYGIALQAALNYFHTERTTPPGLVMLVEGERLIAAQEDILGKLGEAYYSLLELIYATDASQLAPDYIINSGMLQRLLDEIKMEPKLRAAAQAGTKEVSKLVEDIQLAYTNSRVAPARHIQLFSVENMMKFTDRAAVRPTGIDFIDVVIGGLRSKSMVGMMAEVAGGKTMFGTQFVCEQVLRNRNVMYLQYEQDVEGDIAERFYSYAAGATRKELEGGYSKYSDELKRKLAVVGEKYNQYMRVYEMSGKDARGGVQDIESMLLQNQRTGWTPETIVIDWLRPMVMKWYNLPKGTQDADLREKIQMTLDKLKELRDRYTLNILVLHQIAANVMAMKNPLFVPDWTVAAECKSFGEMFNYVICFGRRDRMSNCMWMNMAKARESQPQCRVIKMDAESNRLLDMGDVMVENPSGGRSNDDAWFVTKSDW